MHECSYPAVSASGSFFRINSITLWSHTCTARLRERVDRWSGDQGGMKVGDTVYTEKETGC